MKKFMKGNKNKEERGVADAAGGVEDGDVVCFRGLELKVNIKSPQTQQSPLTRFCTQEGLNR